MNCGVGDLRNYTVATDLNLCNVVLLMMNHSSCHVCVWSDHAKDALHKKGNQRTNSATSSSLEIKIRIKEIWTCYPPPILCDNIDNETPVIFLLTPPELHLHIEPVNSRKLLKVLIVYKFYKCI